jgi:hypothetical protein
VECYNRKTKDSKFSKIDDNLIAKVMSMFTAPPVLPTVALLEPSG